jgi:hypothetical protein
MHAYLSSHSQSASPEHDATSSSTCQHLCRVSKAQEWYDCVWVLRLSNFSVMRHRYLIVPDSKRTSQRGCSWGIDVCMIIVEKTRGEQHRPWRRKSLLVNADRLAQPASPRVKVSMTSPLRAKKQCEKANVGRVKAMNQSCLFGIRLV